MSYEAIIGLEIHVEMKTRSKMFSSAPNYFSRSPNTQVAPLDMAFPGAMPTVNKQAVINGIRCAHALHMEIERTLVFDRKNYFYSDLAKGYQITQHFHPLGQDGYLTIIDKEGNPKDIPTIELHLEEDTAKQIHRDTYSLLDYNRSGVPLVEIVSGPALHSGYEAARYVEAIRNIVVYAGVSDGKMQEGSIRVDVNISLRKIGEGNFGTRVELKNLNSLKNIELAIDYEIKRQSECREKGIPIEPETRRYDEAGGVTMPMRLKMEGVDYRYFPDPNLVPIRLSEEFIAEAIATCPELYEDKKQRYMKLGLSATDASIILADVEMAAYFEAAIAEGASPKIVSNFLKVEVNQYLRDQGIPLSSFPLPPVWLGQIAAFQEEGYSHDQCVSIFQYVLKEQISPLEAKTALKILPQINDNDLVRGFVLETLEANPRSIADFKAGKDRALGYLVGQALKLAKGQASPSAIAKVMEEELKQR